MSCAPESTDAIVYNSEHQRSARGQMMAGLHKCRSFPGVPAHGCGQQSGHEEDHNQQPRQQGHQIRAQLQANASAALPRPCGDFNADPCGTHCMQHLPSCSCMSTEVSCRKASHPAAHGLQGQVVASPVVSFDRPSVRVPARSQASFSVTIAPPAKLNGEVVHNSVMYTQCCAAELAACLHALLLLAGV